MRLLTNKGRVQGRAESSGSAFETPYKGRRNIRCYDHIDSECGNTDCGDKDRSNKECSSMNCDTKEYSKKCGNTEGDNKQSGNKQGGNKERGNKACGKEHRPCALRAEATEFIPGHCLAQQEAAGQIVCEVGSKPEENLEYGHNAVVSQDVSDVGGTQTVAIVCWCGATLYARSHSHPKAVAEISDEEACRAADLEAHMLEKSSDCEKTRIATVGVRMAPVEEALKLEETRKVVMEGASTKPARSADVEMASKPEMKYERDKVRTAAEGARRAVEDEARDLEQAQEDKIAGIAVEGTRRPADENIHKLEETRESAESVAEIMIDMRDTFGNESRYTGPSNVKFADIVRRHCKHFSIHGKFNVIIEATGIRKQTTLQASGLRSGSKVTLHIADRNSEKEQVCDESRGRPRERPHTARPQ